MNRFDKSAVLGLLPTPVRQRLDELVAQLQSALGDKLASVIVHGSAVRGSWVAERSDVDVIIVVKGADIAKLKAIGPALHLARASSRIECMILEEHEIAGAADVFPLLYDDIRAAHSVLTGSDPFAQLVIVDEHRRLRIEQELRDSRIRLRRLVADHAADVLFEPRGLAGPLERKLKQLRSPLYALLQLRGEKSRDDLDSVLRHACKMFDVDDTALHHLRDAPERAAVVLGTLLDRAITAVDAHAAHAARGGAS